MSSILTIVGSPAATSRSTQLSQALARQLVQAGHAVENRRIRDLPAEALLHADFEHPRIEAASRQLGCADAVVVATPICQAAYSGILKAFLDLLPQTALQGKIVLPLATGGSPAHQLAVDYALRPVLNALGARHILGTVFASDAQLAGDATHGYTVSAELSQRLRSSVCELNAGLRWPRLSPAVVDIADTRQRLSA